MNFLFFFGVMFLQTLTVNILINFWTDIVSIMINFKTMAAKHIFVVSFSDLLKNLKVTIIKKDAMQVLQSEKQLWMQVIICDSVSHFVSACFIISSTSNYWSVWQGANGYLITQFWNRDWFMILYYSTVSWFSVRHLPFVITAKGNMW